MEKRNVLIRKNIIGSILFKFIGVLISFVLVPMTISYINPDEYGVWLTISSVFSWIAFFDIGLTNGLRNKLTEAFAENDYDKAQKLNSTTFALLSIIVLALIIIFSIVNNWLDWNKILNVQKIDATNFNLHQLIYLVFLFFCFQFLFKTVGVVFVALQKPAVNDFFISVGSLISLVGVWLLTQFIRQDKLFFVSVVFSASSALVYIIAYFVVFGSIHKKIRPKFRKIDWSLSNELLKLGTVFFFLQLSGVVLYLSSNLIIAQLFSQYAVTEYNIAFKYANMISVVSLIVITPLWSSSTDAYVNKDFKWFQDTNRKMNYFLLLVVLGSIVMVAFSPIFYKIWIKEMVHVPMKLTISVVLYNILFVYSSIYIYMLNGIGKLKLQTISAVFEIILLVPTCVLLGKWIGVEGVPLGMSLILLGRCIWSPIQLRRIRNNTATGIWIK